MDDGYLQKVKLELELEELLGKQDFLKKGYDEVCVHSKQLTLVNLLLVQDFITVFEIFFHHHGQWKRSS